MPMPFLTPGALALAASLATAPARPAGTTVSYAERYAAQKSFAEEYAKSHPATVAKPADLDRFYARLEAAWAKSLGPRTDPALARLDPQIYVTAMLAVTARKEPDWARCHLWSQ